MLKKTQFPISKWRAVILRDPAIGPGLAGGYRAYHQSEEAVAEPSSPHLN
jgi:hypothetical protein